MVGLKRRTSGSFLARPGRQLSSPVQPAALIGAIYAAYFYFMRDDPELIRSVAPQHAAYWHSRRLNGYAGGPFADQSGGLITFASASAEEARALVECDPFVTAGLVARSWLKEWQPE